MDVDHYPKEKEIEVWSSLNYQPWVPMTGSYKLQKEKEYFLFVDLYFLVSTRPEARTLKSTTVRLRK